MTVEDVRPSPEGEQPTLPDVPAELVPHPPGPRLGRLLRLGALVALIALLGLTQGVSMLIVVAAIVVMIFLHELGHYVMAKRAGMLVTEFFIGFGPRIWSFQRGETEYGIKAIPAGAYVKIIGMSNLEEVDPRLEDRTYRQGSFWERIGVAVAGSTMHFLIALVLLTAQFLFIGDPTSERWMVATVVDGSAADEAGVLEGDEIVAVGGAEVDSFDSFSDVLADVDVGSSELLVVRDGDRVALPIELSRRSKIIGTVGEDVDVIDNGDGPVLGTVGEETLLAETGLETGAALTTVNGREVADLSDVAAAVAASDGGTVVLGTDDADEVPIELGTAVDTTEPGSFVGVGREPVLEPTSLPEAAVGSVRTFGEMTVATFSGLATFLNPANLVEFVGDVISGSSGESSTDVPTPATDGPSAADETRPISIVGVAILGSDLSLSSLIVFLAALNIFIGIFNLFPWLPFDGGHVVVACYEKVQELRRRTTTRYFADVSRMMPVAYALLLVLVVVGLAAVYNDLANPLQL